MPDKTQTLPEFLIAIGKYRYMESVIGAKAFGQGYHKDIHIEFKGFEDAEYFLKSYVEYSLATKVFRGPDMTYAGLQPVIRDTYEILDRMDDAEVFIYKDNEEYPRRVVNIICKYPDDIKEIWRFLSRVHWEIYLSTKS